jgi:hypothetical protein
MFCRPARKAAQNPKDAALPLRRAQPVSVECSMHLIAANCKTDRRLPRPLASNQRVESLLVRIISSVERMEQRKAAS